MTRWGWEESWRDWDQYKRFERWYGVQYHQPDHLMQGWVFSFTTMDEDKAHKGYHEGIMQSPQVYWRLVLCGPPQYNYVVREVLKYQEPKES